MFYESTVGEASKKVYGLFHCRNDIGLDDCSSCVKEASQKIIEDCPLYGEGIVWYYECMLRYANRDIFALYERYPGDKLWERDNVSDYAVFGPIFAKEINGVIKNASSADPHFAYSEANLTLFENLYTFAQCTSDIDSTACNNCLKTALSNMIHCCNASIYTMIFLPSCQLRYDMSPFLKFGATTPAPLAPPASNRGSGTNKKTSLKPAIIGAIAACVLVGLLVLSVVLWICLCRERTEEVSSVLLLASPAGLHDDPETVKFNEESLGDKEFEQYDFDTEKIATRNFSAETMLGEGGFGDTSKWTGNSNKEAL